MKTRIYLVNNSGGDGVALVRAKTRAQALAHFARKSYQAVLPSQDDLVFAVGLGFTIEDAQPDLEDAA